MKTKAQVWIETAIYTLIGLTIIAILLSFATPQIEKIKDAGIIKQTISALNIVDEKILEIEQTAGNIRIINFKVAKGALTINSEADSISYKMENTRLEFSEPGEEIKEGNIILRTEKNGRRFDIILTMNYNNSLNMTYDGRKETKILQAGATPYKIQIENIGDQGIDDKTHLDFNII